MENKNTVIDAKIGNLNKLTKVLSVKEQAQEQLLVVIKALGIGKIVRNLKFEKAQGYSLTLKQRKEQFKEKRNAKNPDYARKAECDESKLEMAKRMLCHVVGHGINFKYVLADSWFTCESLIQAVRELCRGYLGLGKCQSRNYNAQIADTTLCFMMYQMLSLAKRFSEYETLGALFRSERDRLQVLTLWSRTLEEVRHLLEVLSREVGVDLLACLSTVATRQTADFSTKVWAHLLCDSDDYAMPDLP